MPPAALVMEGVSKHFAGVQALNEVGLTARAGEVLALMGENGAGKSTLLKILSGAYTPEAGRIQIDGKPVAIAAPADAHRLGVRVVAQEPEIIPYVSVAENVYAGALPRRGQLIDRAALRAKVAADIQRSGFSGMIDPDQLGNSLSPAQRQLVEILRALSGAVRVIAFDEPTSSLSDHEAETLFALIKRLTASGDRGDLRFAPHEGDPARRHTRSGAARRPGRRRASGGGDQRGRTRAMMVGRDLSALYQRSARSPGQAVLSVENVSSADVRDVSFEVRAGEVVVLAGLVGAGRTELARAIIGDVPLTSGKIRVDGQALQLRSPRDAVRAGLCLAPEERKAQALLMKRSVRENISLAVLQRLSRWHVVNRREERQLAERYLRELHIRTPSIDQEVATLSGGNQQKTVLARWLARDSKLLILDEPTRGVDVAAKAEIYAIIDRLASRGVAVLVVSSELPEVLGLADRIVVMKGGRVSGTIERADATEEKILSLAILDKAA